jgi:hypothetical protein
MDGRVKGELFDLQDNILVGVRGTAGCSIAVP